MIGCVSRAPLVGAPVRGLQTADRGPQPVTYFAASYTFNPLIDQFGTSAADSVNVMRTNFARTGAKRASVRLPSPWPVKTGLLQVLPSVDTLTV